MHAVVSAGLQCRNVMPIVTLALLLLVFGLSAGCENQLPAYPADLSYPARADPLVTEQLAEIPAKPDDPGQLSTILTSLKDAKDRQLVLEPSHLKPEQSDRIDALLEKMFGTPAEPKISAKGVKGFDDDTQKAVAEAVKNLKLDSDTLARGSALYRLHCLHCHGLSGNGRGPTAAWVNPHPRDYRSGVFKFTSSSQPDKERKPRRDDLVRTLKSGIEGTSMPSFGLLPNQDIEDLVSYVIHLSIRGQLEFNLMRDLLSGTGADQSFEDKASDNLQFILKGWNGADRFLIRPEGMARVSSAEDRKKSIENGWKLFRDTSAAGCISCHKDYGRQSLYFYDAWGTIGRPTDLTLGVYRGGRRPVDFYWRIHSGVNGSNMPAFYKSLKAQEIWDLVNFVQILPYPKQRSEYGIDID
jgi:mono/diheme cytochrome c family protein